MEENKEVQVVNEQPKVELNTQKTKNNKSLIIAGVIVALLVAIGAIVYFVIRPEFSSVENADESERLIANGIVIEEDDISFSCTLSDEKGNELNIQPPYTQGQVFGKGDYLLCNVGFEIGSDYSTKGLTGMTFDFVSEGVTVKNVLSLNNELEAKMSKNKKGTFIVTKTTDSNNTVIGNEFSKVKLHLYIEDSKKANITLENLVLGSRNNANNDYINKKSIDINIGTSRIYKKSESLKDATIIVEKTNKKGIFEKNYEHKCENFNCNINPASTSFMYQNDNKNIVMIQDYNSDYTSTTTMMYDLEKGIIGTYGGGAAWLNASNRDNNNYIYIQANATSKFGVIDKNGNVIHDFNLDDIDAVTQIGLIDSVYSVEDNLIVDKKNGKYGVVRITSDEKVIDYNFDSIRLFATNVTNGSTTTKAVSGKYFRAKINNKWYLYSFETKNKVYNEGYDYIHVINDQIVIVANGNLLNIKDVNNKNLISAPVQNLATAYADYACCGENMGIEVNIKDNVINIETYPNTSSGAWDNRNHYQYNITTKTFTKIK